MDHAKNIGGFRYLLREALAVFRLAYFCLPAIICTGLCQADQVTYLFTGDCTVKPETPNCTGTVSASLVLQNYTQGIR